MRIQHILAAVLVVACVLVEEGNSIDAQSAQDGTATQAAQDVQDFQSGKFDNVNGVENCTSISVIAAEGMCKNTMFTANLQKTDDAPWNRAYLPLVFGMIKNNTCLEAVTDMCALVGAEPSDHACVQGGSYCPLIASISGKVGCNSTGQTTISHTPECREDELCPWDILNKYKVPSMPCCTELRDSLLTICKGKSVYEIEQQLAEGGAIHENGVVNLGIGSRNSFRNHRTGEMAMSCSNHKSCFPIDSEEVIWGIPSRTFCERYEIVEKPYIIIFASTTIFAVIDFALKQISCKVAPADAQMNQVVPELQEESKAVKVMSNMVSYSYYLYQAALSVYQAVMIMMKVLDDPSLADDAWRRYNVLVYVLIHSSALVTGVSLTAAFIKSEVTGEGEDESKFKTSRNFGALILVTGGCAAGMLFTHWIPGIFLYCWYFISAAGLVYITWNVFNKLWARLQKKIQGEDDEDLQSQVGGLLVQVVLVPLLVLFFQTSAALMVRVYDGQLQVSYKGLEGYMQPVVRDYLSRDFARWSVCTFKADADKGITQALDFINLIS